MIDKGDGLVWCTVLGGGTLTNEALCGFEKIQDHHSFGVGFTRPLV